VTASATVSEKLGALGISFAIVSVSAGVKPRTRPTSLMQARDLRVPKVMICPTESRPYLSRTYSMTSSRHSSQKSMSMSGMLMRSGLRKRSNRSPYLSGSILVIARLYATSDPAAEPRPGPTGIPRDLA